jgi:hypothetical protein
MFSNAIIALFLKIAMPAGVGITPFSKRPAFVEEKLHPIRRPPTTLQNLDKIFT